MKRIAKEQKGITLVALVVTIIILLILAGVAIATVTGDNGLFRKAREAVNTYKDAESDEADLFSTIESELAKAKIDFSKIYDKTGYAKETTPITTTEGTYYIPEGFKLAEDSAGKISDGIVVEDKNGNQWVWIPCYVDGGKGADVANAIKYDRYAFTRDDWEYKQTKLNETDEDGSYKIIREDIPDTYFHEQLGKKEQNSIKEYGGFYLGRYESGDKTLTNAETPRFRTNSDGIDNTVVIKREQYPYNYVTQTQCITLSNEFGINNNYGTKMFTRLSSSYAWDTAIKFIEKTHPTYGETTENKENQLVGQYNNNKYGIGILKTGQTIPVCNIYDMGGNMWEYSTESCGNNYVFRGGGQEFHNLWGPASTRYNYDGGAYSVRSFRITLYLSND